MAQREYLITAGSEGERLQLSVTRSPHGVPSRPLTVSVFGTYTPPRILFSLEMSLDDLLSLRTALQQVIEYEQGYDRLPPRT